MKALQNAATPRRTTRSVPGVATLTLALVLVGTACDRGVPTEPPAPAHSVTTAAFTYFTSTPPDPAYVGETYLVTAEDLMGSSAPLRLSSQTPSVCAFEAEEVIPPATVGFLTVGTCRLYVECTEFECPYYGLSYVQEFPVISRWTPGSGRPPAPPRGRP